MPKINLIFLGSFQEYSSVILSSLLADERLDVKGVVTTPEAEKNPVQVVAENQGMAVFTPGVLDEASLAEMESKFGKVDLLLTAGYGKLLPESWLSWPTVAALNLHFSLLPKYRGANPAEWAILCGESETGVTLIEMSSSFDTGKIVASAAVPITNDDTRETVYQKLYTLGGQVLPDMLEQYLAHPQAQPQTESSTPYATRLKRDDGFIDWRAISAAMKGEVAGFELCSLRLQEMLAYSNQKLDAVFIERAIRALAGFPGVWTKISTTKGEKRMKLLSAHLQNQKLILGQVQIEGKAITKWAESKNSVIE